LLKVLEKTSRQLPEESTPYRAARASRRRDEWGVVFIVSVISVIATVWYVSQNALTLYPDGVAHMEIGRRFLGSATPGFGQLGGVWLPLPQLLMQPFIWFDPLYYSGLAGSLVSMGSYVVASLYIYRTLRGLDVSYWPAAAG